MKGKTVIAVCAVVVALGLSTAALVRVNANEEKKTVGSTFSYAIGQLDETGKYVADTSQIYMKSFIKCAGLTIKLKDDASVKYQVNFYDEDKEFISATEWLAADFDATTIPATAEYCKIEVKPSNDAEVSTLEQMGYINQLTIKIDK